MALAPDDLTRRIVIETVLAATERLAPPEAAAVAEAIGRRVGAALPGEADAREALSVLRLDSDPAPLPPDLASALARGVEAAEGRPEAPAPPAGPAATAGSAAAGPWGTPGARPRDLATAARRAAHDLNQPLTVILGYAAILKRTGGEPLRLEAAEHIVKEARKMSEIIAGLSRLARGLDAA